MKKLNLSLDELQVESFGTTPEQMERRGTVHANNCLDSDVACTQQWSGCNYTVDSCPWTGMASCGETCGCSDAAETCADQCPLSYWTDCHRC